MKINPACCLKRVYGDKEVWEKTRLEIELSILYLFCCPKLWLFFIPNNGYYATIWLMFMFRAEKLNWKISLTELSKLPVVCNCEPMNLCVKFFSAIAWTIFIISMSYRFLLAIWIRSFQIIQLLLTSVLGIGVVWISVSHFMTGIHPLHSALQRFCTLKNYPRDASHVALMRHTVIVAGLN